MLTLGLESKEDSSDTTLMTSLTWF
uniref:Drosophila DNA for transposable element D near 3'end of dnc protein n=1 Tax=Drosophila melanogaster TaxID=7227 RepID=V9H1H0_DROME|nr:unnamed protein product [Drosophila melanogaster]